MTHNMHMINNKIFNVQHLLGTNERCDKCIDLVQWEYAVLKIPTKWIVVVEERTMFLCSFDVKVYDCKFQC